MNLLFLAPMGIVHPGNPQTAKFTIAVNRTLRNEGFFTCLSPSTLTNSQTIRYFLDMLPVTSLLNLDKLTIISAD